MSTEMRPTEEKENVVVTPLARMAWLSGFTPHGLDPEWEEACMKSFHAEAEETRQKPKVRGFWATFWAEMRAFFVR